MNGLNDFVRSMTFWNWIALIAFIFFPLSALNAFFGLRTRYLDWRGTRSKQRFERRLQQLRIEFVETEKHHKNLARFFIYMLDQLIKPLICMFAAILFFIGAFAIYRLPLAGFRTFEFLYLVIAMVLMIYGTHLTTRAARSIKNVNSPEGLVREIIDIIKEGRLKGFIPMKEEDFVDSMIFSTLFDTEHSQKLHFYWGEKQIEVARKLFKSADDIEL